MSSYEACTWVFQCTGRHLVIFLIPEVSWVCHGCIQNIFPTSGTKAEVTAGAFWRALMAVWTQGSPAYPVHCEAQNTSFPFVSQLKCSALHSCEADHLTLWPDNSICQASIHLEKAWTVSGLLIHACYPVLPLFARGYLA